MYVLFKCVYTFSMCASSCWHIHSIFFTSCCCMCCVCVSQPPSSNQHVTFNSSMTCITLLASYVHIYLQIRTYPPCPCPCSFPSLCSYVSDSTTAFFVVFLLFIIPSQPCCSCQSCRRPVKCKSGSHTICIAIEWAVHMSG